MAERFSPEYIQEVTTKMPHVQAQWHKRGVRIGDWIYTDDSELHGWCALSSPKPLLVMDELDGQLITHIGISYGRSTDYQDEMYACGATAEEILKRSKWIPTLSRLMDMLKSALDERCGYVLSFNEDESDIGQMAYRCYQVTPLEWLGASDDTPYSDRELTVARLLERILAGKEETNA